MKISDKETYTKEEVMEIIRQVIFHGDPETYDKGGVLGTINIPPGHTQKRAQQAFKKYCLKNIEDIHSS
jgi:hypothetical protein